MPELHAYQKRAVKHLRKHPHSALALDMGLGKTAVTLRALEPRHLPALVIAPKRVASNVWPAEVAKWTPHLDLSLATGSPAQRTNALEADAALTVIGRDVIHQLTAKQINKYQTIILDELSSFRAVRSQRTKAAKHITKSKPYVWGLTGTPTPKSYIDLWPQMFLLDRGKRLGPTLTGYRNEHFTPGFQLPNGVIARWDIRPGHDRIIRKKIKDLCLSMRSKDYLDLPPVTHNDVEVELPSNVARIMRTLKRDGVAGNITADNAAAAISKLLQCASGAVYDEAENVERLHTVKTAALREIVDSAQGSGVLVFYAFKHELADIRRELGDVPTPDTPGALEQWDAGEVPVLAAHPASAGHGLNLQHGGHTIVWTTPTYDLELWAQANARLARQGQTHPVVIHRLVSDVGPERAVYDALERKASVQDALMDYLRKGGKS